MESIINNDDFAKTPYREKLTYFKHLIKKCKAAKDRVDSIKLENQTEVLFSKLIKDRVFYFLPRNQRESGESFIQHN